MSAVLPEWEWLYELIVVDAFNLPTVHFRNQISPGWKKMDPFIALLMNGTEIFRSDALKGGDINPTWNLPINFRLQNAAASVPGAHIVVSIGHLSRPIGTASIPLSEFPEGGEWTHMQLNVSAGENAYPGDTQATINVMLLKRRVPANAAVTTAAAGASPSSSSGNISKLLVGGLKVGLRVGMHLAGVCEHGDE